VKGLVLASVIAAFVAAAIAAGVAEFLNAKWGGGFRAPFYAGIGSGLVLAMVGLPFAIKIASIGGDGKNSGFWMWWGTGLLTRLVLMAGFALGLDAGFSNAPAAALLPMVGVYLAGMFCESAWVAKILFRTDTISKTL
jgi:hypothetical protein